LIQLFRAYVNDKKSLKQFGITAPKYAETINVLTADIETQLTTPIKRRASGVVMSKDWYPVVERLDKNPKISYCIKHWQNGLSWEESGAIDFHMKAIEVNGRMDNCRTRADVERRLSLLDNIWQLAKLTQKLKLKREISPFSFREYGGILVHIDRQGKPIFGLGGQHRLAIALTVGLRSFPAQLGVIHPNALSKLQTYRI
jgi:hypothetical protein